MKRFFKYLLLGLLLLIVGFCVYIYFLEKVEIHIKPNRDRTFYQPDTTVFSIPVSLSVRDIEKLANNKLKPVLFDDRLPVRKAKDTLHLKISRSGNIRFHLLNNVLTAYVPLDAAAYYTLHTVGKRSRTFFKEKPVIFSLEVILETPLKLNDHYGFNPRTRIREIKWKTPPVIHLGPIKKEISKEAEDILVKKETEITAKLDSVLREKISLYKPMSKIWKKIQKATPLKLDKGNITLYLRKQPLSAAVWVRPQNRDSLHFTLQLKGLLYILHAPDTLRFKTVDLPKKLPVLRQEPGGDTSHFRIQVALPLKILEKIGNQKLAGKTLAYAGYKIGLKKIKIVNGQENIMLSIKYKGDFNGEVRVKGFPQLDVKQKTFSITNLEFDSKEDNVILGSAEKFFHNDIREKIKESVKMDLQKMVDTLPLVIQGGIDKSKLSSKAEVQLRQFEIHQVKTKLTVKYVQLMIRGSAKVRMNLKKAAIVKSK